MEWVETVSDNREPFLESGKVDLVLASYSITDERRQLVGQTGPYMVTGQQVLVKSDSDVEGIARPEGQGGLLGDRLDLDRQDQRGGRQGRRLRQLLRVRQKVLDGAVEGMSTDGTILAGFAAQNEGELKVVGEPFSEERIGVGYSKDTPEMCQWINDQLEAAFEDGSWAERLRADPRPLRRGHPGASGPGLLQLIVPPGPGRRTSSYAAPDRPSRLEGSRAR